MYEVDQALRGGELSLSVCPGWEIDLQKRKKLQIPGGVPRRSMVTSKIEPCINTSVTGLNKYSGDWIE